MRGIYILSGPPSARVEKGPWLDSKGKALGFDLWLEIAKNKWVPTTALSDEEFAAVKDQLQIGIYDAQTNRVYTHLEPSNVAHRLIAMREGLQAAFQKGFIKEDAATFKAQILDPLSNLARQLEDLQKKIQKLKTLESEERKAALEALKARTKRLKRKAVELQKELQQQHEVKPLIKPEDVEPHPTDYLWDFIRAWKGQALSTQALQQLVKAQRIGEYIDQNNDLLLNSTKMAALRNMLLS